MRKVAKDPVRKAMMADLSVADLSDGEDEMKKKKRERERAQAATEKMGPTPRRLAALALISSRRCFGRTLYRKAVIRWKKR